MKKHNRYIKAVAKRACLLAMAATALMGCEDFLTITPLNSIVVENYWQKKSEVEAVVASFYYDMQASAFTYRLIAWGELRGDNLTETTSLQNNTTLYDFYTNNIQTTNTYNDWAAFYNVINLCNTVIYYAPQAQEADGNFTEDELHAYEAEVRAVRALCYFYLVRTFNKVPLVTQASIGDDEDFKVAASSEEDVLSFIEEELVWAEQYIWDRNYFDDLVGRKGRFNKQNVKALLADVYLWHAKYQECADLCGEIMDEKLSEYNSQLSDMSNGDYTTYTYNGALALYEGYPLLDCTQSSHYVYGRLYIDGNSFESLLEMQYDSDNGQANDGLVYFYGSNSQISSGIANAALYLTDQEDGDLFSDKNDVRLYENTGYDGTSTTSTGYYVQKFRVDYSSSTNSTQSYSLRSTYANWIVYKLTDVMLMRAEALAYLGGDANSQEAFNIVKAVNARSCVGISKLTYDGNDIKQMVLDERQRELMFEGKRWFDLVRMVRHSDNPVNAMSDLRNTYLMRKYQNNGRDAVTRLASVNNLFLPFYQSEVDVNPLLEADQNPAYSE